MRSVGRTSRIALLLAMFCLSAAQSGLAATYRYRVRKPLTSFSQGLTAQQISAIVGAGFRFVEDYGAFLLIEGTRSDVSDLQAATGLGFDRLVNAFRIQLAGIDIDTSAGAAPPAVDPDLTLEKYAGPVGLYLLQFEGPIRQVWIDALRSIGARPVRYVGSDAYAVASRPSLESLRAQLSARTQVSSAVQYLSLYQPAYKVAPDLRAIPLSSREELPLTLVLDGGQDLSKVIAALTALGADPFSDLTSSRGIQRVRFSATAAQARALARLSSVLWVEIRKPGVLSDERVDQVLLGNISGGQPSNPGEYAAALAALGLTPQALSSEIVDVLDTGIQLSNVDGAPSPACIVPSSVQLGPADLNNSSNHTRLVYACPSDPSASNNIADGFGHGTLVTGIIGGNPLQVGGPPLTEAKEPDPNGFFWDMGVAPGVRFGSTKLWDNNANPFPSPQSYSALANIAYGHGSRYQNSSWNKPDVGYTAESAEYDYIVRTSGSDDVSHSMTVVFSGGNIRNGVNTQSPATAKNVISVGSSGITRDGVGGCNSTLSLSDITNFSSRGAEFNAGIYKPDLVAPGQVVVGAKLSLLHVNMDECYGSTNALPGTGGFYYPGQGTSYSAPQVTGAAVLIRKTLGSAAPSLVKAALIASAESMNGGTDQYTGATLGWEPTPVQGWGRLSLKRFFDGTPSVHSSENPALAFTATGQTSEFTYTVADPSKPVLIALAWTDTPGAEGVPTPLVNSIGLYAYSGSNYYCDGPNYYGSQYHVPTNACFLPPDETNNAKMIRIAPNTFPANGQFTIQLYAFNISAGPGPGIGDLSQDWSVYVYNAR